MFSFNSDPAARRNDEIIMLGELIDRRNALKAQGRSAEEIETLLELMKKPGGLPGRDRRKKRCGRRRGFSALHNALRAFLPGRGLGTGLFRN